MTDLKLLAAFVLAGLSVCIVLLLIGERADEADPEVPPPAESGLDVSEGR